VVNKSSYASLNAAIALAGYVPFSNATVYSYGIPQDNAARTASGCWTLRRLIPRSPARASTMFSRPIQPRCSRSRRQHQRSLCNADAIAGRPVRLSMQGQSVVPYVVQMSTNLASTKLACAFHQYVADWHD